MKLNWLLKNFDSLTAKELYAIMQLRNQVFVVEQNCAYQDADDKDQKSYHFMAWDNDTLVAYTRLLPPAISFAEASIGRVVTSPKYRHIGAGRELMKRSIDNTFGLFNCTTIKIGAQLYLKKFYEDFGFIKYSAVYLEDNIEHIEMLLQQ